MRLFADFGTFGSRHEYNKPTVKHSPNIQLLSIAYWGITLKAVISGWLSECPVTGSPACPARSVTGCVASPRCDTTALLSTVSATSPPGAAIVAAAAECAVGALRPLLPSPACSTAISAPTARVRPPLPAATPSPLLASAVACSANPVLFSPPTISKLAYSYHYPVGVLPALLVASRLQLLQLHRSHLRVAKPPGSAHILLRRVVEVGVGVCGDSAILNGDPLLFALAGDEVDPVLEGVHAVGAVYLG